MADSKHYGKQVVLSLIVTVVVLALILCAFGMFLIPKYNIKAEQIYGVAIKVFPLLIGLIMIQVGVMIAHRHDGESADDADRLPPNAYDRPLRTMPGDDPAKMDTQDLAQSQAVVSPVEDALPVIAETVSPSLVSEKAEAISNSFESIFDTELKSAREGDYDLTLAVLSAPEEYREKLYDKLAVMVSDNSYPYILESGIVALIFPFYSEEEAKKVVEDAKSTLASEFNEVEIKSGYSSRNGRVLSTDIMLHEATTEGVLHSSFTS